MKLRSRWPWITTLLAIVLVLNPVGLDILSGAFFSSEALSRNIWQPIVLTGIAALVATGALEWFFRRLAFNRRGRGATT
jgi:hypothetical protein